MPVTEITPSSFSELQVTLRHWRGLGLWNLYFLFKLVLYWQGAINFHALENLIFAAFLLMPLPPLWLHRLRHLLSIPVGLLLFYHDTWLPPLSRLLAQSSQVAAFSPAYLWELAGRIISVEWLGIAFLMLVGYLFVASWLRVSVPVVLVMLWLGLAPLFEDDIIQAPPIVTPVVTATPHAREESTLATPAISSVNESPDQALASFYHQESARHTNFSAIDQPTLPFDVLIINVCSLSWDDIAIAGLEDHPLLASMDIVFDQFNSATSYSGPASIRLLRASCGQTPHAALYEEQPSECLLFDNLARQGFKRALVLNHDGQFDGYLQEIRKGGLDVPLMSQASLIPQQTAFNGLPIYGDLETLQAWDSTREPQIPSATFYNTVTLHDGNRLVGQRGFADYALRLRQLFDDLMALFAQMEKEGRRVAVFIVPEHGAALRGDKMQFVGLREIPNPSITHVPVTMKLIGLPAASPEAPLHIEETSSYLAISELVARLLKSDIYGQDRVDWDALVNGLPSTGWVAENEGTVVMGGRDSPYVRLGGESWMPYPK